MLRAKGPVAEAVIHLDDKRFVTLSSQGALDSREDGSFVNVRTSTS